MKKLIIISLLLIIPIFVFGQRIGLRKIYTSQIGVKEIGKNSGSGILKYQKSAGIKSGMAWCSSFVYWCYLNAGLHPNIIAPAQAASWFIDTKKIIVVRGKVKMSPQPGDIIGIVYNGNRVGHAGFYDSEDSKFYITVEGNTGDEKRDGEGVFKLKRIKRQVTYISNHIDFTK